MTTSMCLLKFSRALRTATTPAVVRRELGKLPTECVDSRCSPGGCRSNCTAYAEGVVLTMNRMKGKRA